MMTPPYKSSNGQWYTVSLFHEMSRERPIEIRACEPVFSFEEDRPGLINCRKTFVEVGDPTGYKWAMQYLGSYEHFERLLDASWFIPHFETWKREILADLKSQAIERIIAISGSSNNEAQALAASKYLAEKGWDKPNRGRPAKDKGEMKRLTESIESTNQDAARIGLTLIHGGK